MGSFSSCSSFSSRRASTAGWHRYSTTGVLRGRSHRLRALRSMALLEVQDLTVSFGRLVAVNRASLAVEDGEILGLIGPNGAGKTTIFNAITGIYASEGGRVRFRNQDILGMRSYEIAGLGVARTFQNIELLGSMSLLDNVLTGFHIQIRQGVLGAALRLPGSARREREARAESLKLLDYVGL